jgi:hypothetical protein
VLSPQEAQALIGQNQRNAEVIFPYLRGEDFTTNPDQSYNSFVINFFDWSEEQAQTYPECYAIIEAKVKPERQRIDEDGAYVLRKPLPQKWWIYADKRPALYRTIAPLKRVLFHSFTSKYLTFAFAPTGIVYAGPHNVFALDKYCYFACLQSSLHEAWVLKHSSTMKTDIRYSSTDAFGTFPLPNESDLAVIENIGEVYYETRHQIMLNRQEGLTATYNRFHRPDEHSDDIQHLRDLHRQMDEAVAAAYGWDDLALEHDFHETAQGVRYTISEAARREVLKRLLALNFERYEEEQRLGVGVDVKKGKRGKKAAAANVPSNGDEANGDDGDPNAIPPEQLSFFDDDEPKQNRLL